MPLRRSTASTATSTRICGVIWIIFLLPAKPAASYPNPVPILSSPRASCRERTPTPLHTPSAPLPVEPTAPETPAALVEVSECTPATASSTVCNPFAAPSWCSAVHAAAPSPPPPPRSSPAGAFAAGSRSATLLIAGSVAISLRVLLSFHRTCPTVLLTDPSSHARLPEAHDILTLTFPGDLRECERRYRVGFIMNSRSAAPSASRSQSE